MSGNVFNANFVQRAVQDKINSVLYGPTMRTGFYENVVPLEDRNKYARIARMMEQLNRRRARTWGAWKDKR